MKLADKSEPVAVAAGLSSRIREFRIKPSATADGSDKSHYLRLLFIVCLLTGITR